MMEGSPKSPCRLQKPFRKFGRGLQKLKNRINEKVDDFKRDHLGCCEYVQLQNEDSVSVAPSTNFCNGFPVPAPPTNSHNYGLGEFPMPAPPTNSHNYGLGQFPVPTPPTTSHNGFGQFPVPTPPTFSHNGFGEFPMPAPPTTSHNGLGQFPVPAPPTLSHNGLGQFPVPAPPTISHNGFGEFPMAADWWPPAGQNDHEASGSNHPSHQNSDYIDAENFDVPAYLRDHQIPNFDALWTRPTLSDQVAGMFDELTVSTPTGQAPSVFLNMDEFFDTVSTEQPELFSPGAISVEQLQQELLDSPHPISTEQSWQTAVTAWDTPSSSVYHGSLMTGNTVASQESLLDTGASDYILQPVPEERRGSPGYIRQPVPEERPSNSEYILQPVPERRPSWIKRPFYYHYTENRRIVRGETGPGRSSGRRGRGFRVLAQIACIAIRRRKLRNCRFIRKRSLNTCYYQASPTTGSGTYELGSSSAGVVQLQNRGSLKARCTKKLRIEGPRAQPKKKQSDNYSRYKGVKPRNAKWKVEIRVSMTEKDKVWITYDTEEEAALAYDALMYHCSKKKKMYNFPILSSPANLGPSHYDVVLEHCKNGRFEDAKQLVKELANLHAANYAAVAAALAASTSCTTPSCF